MATGKIKDLIQYHSITVFAKLVFKFNSNTLYRLFKALNLPCFVYRFKKGRLIFIKFP